MKVYIITYESMWSSPEVEKVVDSEEKAKEFCNKNRTIRDWFDYREYEVEWMIDYMYFTKIYIARKRCDGFDIPLCACETPGRSELIIQEDMKNFNKPRIDYFVEIVNYYNECWE